MRLRDFGFCCPLFFSSLQSQKENESEIGCWQLSVACWLLAIAFVQVAWKTTCCAHSCSVVVGGSWRIYLLLCLGFFTICRTPLFFSATFPCVFPRIFARWSFSSASLSGPIIMSLSGLSVVCHYFYIVDKSLACSVFLPFSFFLWVMQFRWLHLSSGLLLVFINIYRPRCWFSRYLWRQ